MTNITEADYLHTLRQISALEQRIKELQIERDAAMRILGWHKLTYLMPRFTAAMRQERA